MQNLNHPNLVNLIEVKPDADYVKKDGKSYKVKYLKILKINFIQTMAIVLENAASGELFEYVA